jgi:hypothetical protein
VLQAGDFAAGLVITCLRLVTEVPIAAPVPLTPPEGNISVEEAARRLGVSASYIRKNWKTLPFTLRIGTRLLVDTGRLEKYQSQRLLAGKIGGGNAR